MRDALLRKLESKFDEIGQPLDVHLEGLLRAKPLNYWDYIQVDALLSLQTQRRWCLSCIIKLRSSILN